MSTLTLFISEVIVCLGISIALIMMIKPYLRDVLVETCGTKRRAAFWVMFTQLMLVISPLLIVIYFAPTSSPITVNIAETIKDTLFRSLLGDFIALTMIGQVIWKSINHTTHEDEPSHEQESD